MAKDITLYCSSIKSPPPPPSLRRQALTLTALAGEGLPQRNDNFLPEIS